MLRWAAQPSAPRRALASFAGGDDAGPDGSQAEGRQAQAKAMLGDFIEGQYKLQHGMHEHMGTMEREISFMAQVYRLSHGATAAASSGEVDEAALAAEATERGVALNDDLKELQQMSNEAFGKGWRKAVVAEVAEFEAQMQAEEQ